MSPLNFLSLLALAASLVASSPLLPRQSQFSGEATVNPVGSSGQAVGSCGYGLTDSQMFVALSNSFMQSESPSSYCGKQILVTNSGPDGDDSIGGQGNQVTVTVGDTCMGCDEGHLDLSVAAWDQLTNGAGYSVVGINWSFLS